MRVVLFVAVGLLVGLPASGQDLGVMYRTARFLAQVEAHFEERGMRARPASPEHLPSRADTLHDWLWATRAGAGPSASDGEAIRVDAWRLIRRLERPWFEKTYNNTLWAYLGTESLLPLDTTLTRDLRARMEAYFGPPTQTITEALGAGADRYTRDRYIQFEYWFVLNDSIPFVVMDVNGPLERGLIVSSDYRYRDILLRLRESFMEDFARSTRRAAYVDYYYNPIESSWYYAGFDGIRYYLERTREPNFAMGRPWLNPRRGSD